MATFILAAILIIIATLAFLIWPLLFTRNTFSYARHAQNIHYAKERLVELELQLKNASISANDYEALKLEIESTLAQDIDLAESDLSEASPLPRRPNKAAIGTLCLFIPLGAAFFYGYVGTPDAIKNMATQVNSSTAGGQPSADEIRKMIADLEQRMADNPNDLQGWSVLSRTYLALGQYSKARDALKRVIEIGGDSDQAYASLADASALMNNGDMSGEPIQYADKALSLNPNNRQALWLRGLAASQVNDKPTAKKHWALLLNLLDSEPDQQAQLQKIMRDTLGESTEEAMITNATSTEGLAETMGKETATETIASSLAVTIALDSQINAKVSKQDTVFVFARAQHGPPAPLAVKRLTVADLPTTIRLSDHDAMLPQLKMSLFEEIEVMARVSKSGQPIANVGDWESEAVSANPGQETAVELLISTKVTE